MGVKSVAAATMLTAGLTTAALGVAVGTANALPSEPHTWCPGQSMYPPSGPGANYVWDMNVCHTWQYTKGGMGNVGVRVPSGIDPVTYQPTGWTVEPNGNVWDGPNMPPDAAFECGMGFFGVPIRC